MMLARLQNIDREVTCTCEICETWSLSGKTPKNQRRIQRNGRKRVDRHSHFASIRSTGGDDGDAGCKLSQRRPVIAAVKALADIFRLFLHKCLRVDRVHEPREQSPRVIEAVDESAGDSADFPGAIKQLKHVRWRLEQ